MRILRAIDQLKSLDGPTYLAIGVFDGLHIGHQAVIVRAVESTARIGGSAVVVTFYTNPVSGFRAEN
jgi:riboflavin kinase / FMN adenylyltransferase